MKRIGAMLLGATVVGAALAGCSAPAPGENEDAPAVAESSAPIITEEAIVQQGTRDNPIPFGQSATIQEIGEAGGDAWKVTVGEPRDYSQDIVDDAVELYNGDESYVAYSRAPEGEMYWGAPITVERLLDIPEDPYSALDVQLVTSDGRTVETTLMSSEDRPALMDIGEMYAPATATPVETWLVPVGTTGQILVTESNSGARFYFGPKP